MRVVRRRTKKLIVAFHFQLFSNEAGWKCDACRKAGLEIKRRCGWLETAQSLAWLENFLVHRRLRQSWPETLGARETEAFLILEAECEAEAKNG